MGIIRVGFGYDVHKLVNQRNLILGGVQIEYCRGLLGHSDADVLVHAIIDALLGAAALGDIGTHFPDNDLRYKDISSIILLQNTASMIADAGYNICNIDATIVAQQPKLISYIPQMTDRISNALSVPNGNVNIKAKTTEGLGFIGIGDGIAAYAVTCIER